MVSALLGAQTVNLAQWGVFVQSRATQEASHQRRWRRFVQNERVVGENIYVPLVLQAISDWKKKRIYLVLDTTVLWNQYCLISLAIVTGGRAVPFLWLALEHSSASVAWRQYQPLLEKARPYLQDFEEVMLLADRGFANQDLLGWLQSTPWHGAIRLPSNTQIRGVGCRGFSYAVEELYPPKREVIFYEKVSLWQEGTLKANLALASVPGAKQNWAIITDEPLSLEIFGQYGLRFRTEHLFGDSKSGVFQSKPWVFCQKLLNINPLPCFACRKAEERYYQALAFSLIRQFQASS